MKSVIILKDNRFLMNSLIKTWDSLGEANQLLLKKGILAGIALYVILLAIHDLMPYAILAGIAFYLYKVIFETKSGS